MGLAGGPQEPGALGGSVTTFSKTLLSEKWGVSLMFNILTLLPSLFSPSTSFHCSLNNSHANGVLLYKTLY